MVLVAVTQAHTSMSKIELAAFEKFPEPRMEEVLKVVPNNKELGAAFKKDQKAIKEALEALDECAALDLKVSTRGCREVVFLSMLPVASSQTTSLHCWQCHGHLKLFCSLCFALHCDSRDCPYRDACKP